MNSGLSSRTKMRVAARALLSAGVVCTASSLGLGQTQPATNPSRPFGPNACGPADPAYIRTANETGGIPLFLQRSEATKAFHLVRESTRNNVATVLWASGTLDGRPKTINIPVDSMTKRITFTLSVDTKGNQLQLTPPSGRAIQEGTAGSEITELNCGRIVTVSSPQAGEWRADITGTGRYWLTAQAQSDIFFVSAAFMKEGGRPGHEGLFRIQGQPVTGTPATLQVSLSAGATQTTEFYLVSEEGETIQGLSLNAVNSDREFLEFAGPVDLPTVPFRVSVAGRDSNGEPYQRFFSNLFHAESVEVSPRPDFDELSPGSTKRVAFVVRNVAFSRVYKMSVTDTHKFVSKVEPNELRLKAEESGTVWVDLTVPARAVSVVGDDVVFVAASLEGPPTSNFSVVRVSVSSTTPQNPH